MSLFPALTRDIDVGPEGPAQVAFFDLDRTLVDGYSVLPFLAEAVATGLLRPGRLLAQLRVVLESGQGGLGPLLEQLIAGLRGEREADLVALGERVFERHTSARIHPEARALVRAHRLRGHRVVIVTSATRYQAEPVARALGIDPEDVLCTRLVVNAEGRFTGRWYLPGCWNEGKRMHARAWLRRHGGALADASFYTDSHEDLPLLERVGRPRVVNPDSRLLARAAMEGWPVLRFRGRRANGESLLRTGLSLSGFYGSALAGAGRLLRGGSVREALGDAVATWSRIGMPLAGIGLRVTGEQYLRAARPAVVVFNHQSALDALIIARLLRRDFTGLCKRELERDLLFGPAFRAAGAIFVDREGGGLAQLRPALEALRAGQSLAVAPEGTRSRATLPGPFKRGAFYLALRARVPLVPVVIHNAVDALPRGSFMLRAGTTIEVEVLPPIDPATFNAQHLQAHADALRVRYLEVLGFQVPQVLPAGAAETSDPMPLAS